MKSEPSEKKSDPIIPLYDEEFCLNDVKTYPVKIFISHHRGAENILIFDSRKNLEMFLIKRAQLREHLKSPQQLSVIRIWE